MMYSDSETPLDFQGDKFQSKDFEQYRDSCRLRNAQFQGAKLERVNFQELYLQGAQFQGANLRSANFQEAILRGAGFQGANLREANLQFADLHESSFKGAKLHGANLKKYEDWATYNYW